MRYSNDLRIKAINLIESGKSQIEVYKFLNIGENTIYRWYKKYKKTNDKTYKENYNTGRPSKIRDLNKFKEFIDNNKDSSLHTLANRFGNVSFMSVYRALNKIGYTFKKNTGYIPKEMKKGE